MTAAPASLPSSHYFHHTTASSRYHHIAFITFTQLFSTFQDCITVYLSLLSLHNCFLWISSHCFHYFHSALVNHFITASLPISLHNCFFSITSHCFHCFHSALLNCITCITAELSLLSLRHCFLLDNITLLSLLSLSSSQQFHHCITTYLTP
jgi:hypothetical protein